MTARVAIVTGASSGIGLGITPALLGHGHRVVATSRTISDSTDLWSGNVVSISTTLVDQALAGAPNLAARHHQVHDGARACRSARRWSSTPSSKSHREEVTAWT